MKKAITLALVVISVVLVGYCGCLERSDTGGYCPVEDTDVLIKEIALQIKCNLFNDIIDSGAYLLVPTLVDALGVPVGMGSVDSPFDIDHNITLEMTPNGWCLNITPMPCYLTIYFNYTVTNATFNTMQQADAIDGRYYKDTPGLSIWEPDNYNTVFTKAYCNKAVSGLSYQYYRADTIGGFAFMVDEFSTWPDAWGPGWDTPHVERSIDYLQPPLEDKV